MNIDWKTCFRVGFSIFILYLCINYWNTAINLFTTLLGAASPLIIGCVIAYLLNILMTIYEQHYFPKTSNRFLCKSRRPVCMVSAIVTLLAIVVLIISLVLPQLASCIRLIFAALPNTIETLIDGIEELNILPENIVAPLDDVDWQTKMGQIVNVLTSGVGNIMDIVISTVSSVFSGIVTALLSIIFAIYLLMGKDTLKKQFNLVMRHYMSKIWYKRITYALSILHDCFRRYIIGQCTEAVIIGVLCTTGMLLLGFPYATMIGALIGFTALIPVAGAYIGGIVGALMIFPVSPVQAVAFLVYLVILQQLEDNLIYPRVVGSSIGLPGIWVLAAITIGGGTMGVTGMLIGVPLAATFYRLLKNDVKKKQHKVSQEKLESKKQHSH